MMAARRRCCVVFLLHGLGAHPVMMAPLQLFLRRNGFPHTFSIAYDVDTDCVGTSVASASRAMLGILKVASPQEASARWDVFVVGHSWGGLTCNRLHTVGWALQGAVYLAAPLHGARILSTLRAALPQWLHKIVARRAYAALHLKSREREPPHAYRTISCGHFNGTFDGAVYRDETVLNPRFHTHLAWEDHSFILIKSRMWRLVQQQLTQMRAQSHMQLALRAALAGMPQN